MYDSSDEATGLEPLSEITPFERMLALRWQIGPSGLVQHPAGEDGEAVTEDVRYLSVRGLLPVSETEQVYTQLHIAFPAEGFREMLETWLALLDVQDSEARA